MRELAAEHELQHEERGRQPPGDDDLRLAQLVERQPLLRDDDRAVAGADRRAVREQRVALVHERVGRERHRRHLEPPVERPLVQRLDVLDHGLELEALRVDRSRREPPEHERIVWIGAEADADQHGGGG